jgi:hypothetical protein
MDKGGNDFERGTVNTFAVSIPGIDRVRDIDFLKLEKSGTDGLCISRVALRFNNDPNANFEKVYPNGHWIDGNDDHKPSVTFSSASLRAGARWNLTKLTEAGMCQLPNGFSATELEAQFEAKLGNAINNPGSSSAVRDLYWGGKKGAKWLALSRRDADTYDGDADMRFSVANLPNPDVDLDFRADVACSNGTFRFSTYKTMLTADFPTWADILSGGLIDAVAAVITAMGRVVAGDIDEMVSLPAPVCPRTSIRDDAMLILDWSTVPAGFPTAWALCL